MVSRSLRHERGQAIVLFAVALIGLLGFSALAFDGGNIYVEQRRTQAAADNAALAAAYQLMQGVTSTVQLQNAVLATASANSYNNDQHQNWVSFYHPPASGPYTGNANYVQVAITETVPTALAQLVYGGPWQVSVQAVAKGRQGTREILYAGQALMAVSPTSCQALWFSGSGQTTVTGAGVFTNSECDGDNQSSSAGVSNGNGGLVVNGGGIGSVGTFYVGGSSSISPTAQTNQPSAPPPSALPIPTASECGPARSHSGGDATLSPGTYANGISVGSNKTVVLQKGIYCLGQGLNIQGTLTTDVNGNGLRDSDEGVLLYIYGAGSPQDYIVDSNAQANPILWALQDDTGPYAAWKGMLIYDPIVCGTISINGGADSYLIGTIFAPCTDVTIQGNSGTFALMTQIVGDTIKITGDGGVDITYDPEELYHQPIQPSVTLVE
jgi:hypothetical protein